MSAARYGGLAFSLAAFAALRLARLALGRERFGRVEAHAVEAAVAVYCEVERLRALPERVARLEALAARLATSESYHARMGADFVRRLGALEARDVLSAADLAEVIREARAAMNDRAPGIVRGDDVLWSVTFRDVLDGLDRAAVLRRERAGRVEGVEGDDAGRGS